MAFLYWFLMKRFHLIQNDRMAAHMAVELEKENVACVSLWPGFVKTENINKFVLSPQDEKVAHETPKFL